MNGEGGGGRGKTGNKEESFVLRAVGGGAVVGSPGFMQLVVVEPTFVHVHSRVNAHTVVVGGCGAAGVVIVEGRQSA